MPKGDLQFIFLPEREIQNLGQTDLETSPWGGVTTSFEKKQAATQGRVDRTRRKIHSTFTSWEK